jgi:hypothetical protein
LAWAESGNQDEKSRGAAAALRLYYARELGLSAIAASELSMIGGKLVVGATLVRALARRSGFRVHRLSDAGDRAKCVAQITELSTGEVLGATTFTIEDAKTAGLIRDRSAWKTHPARMLWARASVNVVRDYTPEVVLGMVLDDEVQEIRGDTTPPAAGSDVPSDDWTPDEQQLLDELAEEHDQDDLEPGDDTDGVETDDIEF